MGTATRAMFERTRWGERRSRLTNGKGESSMGGLKLPQDGLVDLSAHSPEQAVLLALDEASIVGQDG